MSSPTRSVSNWFPGVALCSVLLAASLSLSCGGATAAANANASATKPSSPSSPAALAITTQALPPATNGVSYSAVLAATGGSGAITWTVTSGQLPTGVSLSASGTLSGTPTADGSFPITVEASDAASPAHTVTANLTLVSSGPALDEYGGLDGVTLTNTSGYFRTQKVGERWVFVDPLGHPYFLLGVADVDLNTESAAGMTAVEQKYGAPGGYLNRLAWGLNTVHRLKSWGFNAASEYASAYVTPVGNYGSYETTDPMPWLDIINPALYSLTNSGGYAAGPVKDLINGLDSEYTNYRGAGFPDVYDPNFSAWVNGELAANTSAAEAASPWLIGTVVGDLDNLFGFGQGPDMPAGRAAQTNLGWVALCTNFQQATNSSLGQNYSDTVVYTKQALANWLQSKYVTIAALNAAWGSNYTSFGDDGGYGTGTGLLDEDGRDPWVGNDDAGLSKANAAVAADLNAFLGQIADQYFSVISSALRKYRPNQLVFGPASLDGWNGVSRAQVLAAAGQYCDVVMAGMYDQAVYDFTLKAMGDHPVVVGMGSAANPDSDLAAYANPDSPGYVFNTQAQRGAAYQGWVEGGFAYAGTAAAGSLQGSSNIIGTSFWAWEDSNGEETNWGLVSFRDNPYDGVSGVIAPGTDAWGYATGGEAANYGNFIGPVSQANSAIITALAAALGSQ